jgi:hypothetical protein
LEQNVTKSEREVESYRQLAEDSSSRRIELETLLKEHKVMSERRESAQAGRLVEMERELAIAKRQSEVSADKGDDASTERIKELEEEVDGLKVAAKTLADRYKLGEMVCSHFQEQVLSMLKPENKNEQEWAFVRIVMNESQRQVEEELVSKSNEVRRVGITISPPWLNTKVRIR